MPGGDGTGPNGMGPMTGRGLGYCAGYDTPGFTRGVGMGRGYGRGFGRGRGRGRGLGLGNRGGRGGYYAPPRPYYGTPTQVPVYTQPEPQTVLNNLESEKKYLQDSLAKLEDEIERTKQQVDSE